MRMPLDFYKYKPEWINDFYKQLKIGLADKGFKITCGLLFSTLGIILVINHNEKTATDVTALQNKHNKIILRELDSINSTLQSIEANPAIPKQQQVALQSLENNVVVIEKSLGNTAKSADIHKISNEISSVKNDMDSKFSDLKQTVSQNMGDKQYLDASALPFHVISIDVIAGQPYASVDYANHILPLGLGDLLAGWRLVSADYSASFAEFANDKNQYIKISLVGA